MEKNRKIQITYRYRYAVLGVAVACVLLAVLGLVAGKPCNPSYFSTDKPDTASWMVIVEPDRPGAFYKCGEDVEFTIRLEQVAKQMPVTVRWRVTKDSWRPPLMQGVFTWSGEPIKIKATLDDPGFLQCRVESTQGRQQSKPVWCGVAVSPLLIKPSQPAPDDFDEYWLNQREKLNEVPLHLKTTPIKSPVKGIDCFDVQADIGGAMFSAYLALPSSSASGSLPAIILPHGAGVASSRLGVACAWAQDGFLAIDFNAHGLPNGKERSYYKGLYEGELKDYFRKLSTDPQNMFFNTLFKRIMRAIDVVTNHPAWDKNTLIANGRSQGGGQAIAAAGLDKRIGFIAAQIPALCDHSGALIGRISGWPKIVDTTVNVETMRKQARVASYFDCVHFASRTNAEAFFSVGFIDLSCPPTSVYAAYNQLNGVKEIENHLHTGHRINFKTDSLIRERVLQFVAKKRTANTTGLH